VGGLLATMAANAPRLGVADLTLDYRAVDGPDVASASGRVLLSWRLGGLDRRAATVQLAVTVRDEAGRALLTDVAPVAGPMPLWLQAPVRLRRGSGWMVVTSDPARSLARLGTAASSATEAVARVLPRAKRPLVVELPADTRQFEAALGAAPGEFAALAAVTTTADGSIRDGAPVRVVLNPTQVASMADPGLRVVLSHEATHVATGAPLDEGPLWLTEGFADYVALRGLRSTPSATRAAARLVRAEGLPSGLPDAADFASSGSRLEAAYEESWLACRVVVDRAGERALVRLVRAVAAGEAVDDAVHRLTGWSRRQLVGRWRDRLAHWAT
jgi:hypothetical protein